MRKKRNTYDFSEFGKAIKAARKAKGMTREAAAVELDLAPRYLMALENDGQNPSGQLLISLATMFKVSIDQYVFSDGELDKTSKRRQLEDLLDFCSDEDLSIIMATAKAIIKTKMMEKE